MATNKELESRVRETENGITKLEGSYKLIMDKLETIAKDISEVKKDIGDIKISLNGKADRTELQSYVTKDEFSAKMSILDARSKPIIDLVWKLITQVVTLLVGAVMALVIVNR